MSAAAPFMTVVQAGLLTTVQDAGRFGQGALGIGRSGACDRAAYRLANRLVGNDEGAAVLEVTFGGLVLRAEADVVLVTTGARCAGTPHNAPLTLVAGTSLALGSPVSGARTYVAVRGGFDVPSVLGSRSTDLLAGLGPDVLAVGDRLPVGHSVGLMPGVDVAAVPEPEVGDVVVQVQPGPRRDWFTDDAWASLLNQRYAVTAQSNRVGLRLDGVPLEREGTGELPSEGMVRGALQIPPSGTPVVFLADHPVTGGYPVIGYVVDDDVDRCGQLRGGQGLSFTTRRTGQVA
ncbi:MAG: biotin-dependent carboxyltransferase family protein [Dermatophilaceae bacterium]